MVGRALRQGARAAHAEAPPRGRGRGETSSIPTACSSTPLPACMPASWVCATDAVPWCVLCMQREVLRELNNYGLCARSRLLLGK